MKCSGNGFKPEPFPMVISSPRTPLNGATRDASLTLTKNGEPETTRTPFSPCCYGHFQQPTSKFFRVVAEVSDHELHPQNTLKLDFDRKTCPTVSRFNQLRPRAVSFCRSSNKGWHVVVYLRRRIPLWRVFALQLIKGSDPKREAFNFRRLIHQDPANILFKRKIK